jgi:uncharacterized protein GlcG (DUF336 family)
MTQLTLAQAERLVKSALAKAREMAMNPMCIAVIDASGHAKFALREDGGALAGVEISLGKARAALTFGCTSKQIADALAGNPVAVASILATLQAPMMLLAGGVLIHDQTGEVVGAIGASGDAPDRDEAIVLAATSGG